MAARYVDPNGDSGPSEPLFDVPYLLPIVEETTSTGAAAMREELVGFLQNKKKTSEDKMRLKEKEMAARQEERARELDLKEMKEKRRRRRPRRRPRRRQPPLPS